MVSCERDASDIFSDMFSSKGYCYFLFDLYHTYFSLSQLFGVSIEILLDVFETIGFFLKVKKKRNVGGEEDKEQQHLMEVELELLAEERNHLRLDD